MNIIDISSIAIIGIWALIGFVKGLLSKMLEAAIFLLSSAAAYIYYLNGGGLIGITLVLVAAGIVLHLISWITTEMAFKDKMKVTLAFRFTGGAIGGIEGTVLVMLVLVLLHLVSGITGAAIPFITKTLDASSLYAGYKAVSMASPIPAVKKIYRIGESLRANGGRLTIDEETAGKLREEASIKALLADEQFAESVSKRDYPGIIFNPKLLGALNDMKLLKNIIAAVLQENDPAAAKDGKTKEIGQAAKTGNYITGIVYLQGSRAALINNAMYRVGSQIFGGKITGLTENKMTAEFRGISKQYSIGDAIP